MQKSAPQLIAVMTGMIDFHSHILPGIDDGSSSVEESIKMLQMEAEQGIRQVIATPHFYAKHDSPERFLSRRNKAEQRINEMLEKHPELPRISVGAEVYYFPGISESEALSELTIEKTRCILLEMPHPPWTSSMYQEMEDIRAKQGLVPIIAHVDRYIRPFKTYGIPEQLRQLPVLVQANASFFLHKVTAGMAMRMLKADEIQLLGSDCHNLLDRPPNLGIAAAQIEKCLGAATIARIHSYEEEVLTVL